MSRTLISNISAHQDGQPAQDGPSVTLNYADTPAHLPQQPSLGGVLIVLSMVGVCVCVASSFRGGWLDLARMILVETLVLFGIVWALSHWGD